MTRTTQGGIMTQRTVQQHTVQAPKPKVANPNAAGKIANQRTRTSRTAKKRNRRRMIAPIARSSTDAIHTPAYQKTNVSGTKNTKAGVPERYAMNWRSMSNPAENSQPNWGGIQKWTAIDGVGGLKESTHKTDGWKVVNGKYCNKITVTKNNIITLHNTFSILSLSNNPTFESDNKEHVIVQLSKLADAIASNKQKSLQQRDRHKHVKNTLQCLRESKELFFDESITQAEDEQTAMAKEDTGNAKHNAISTAHKFDKKTSE